MCSCARSNPQTCRGSPPILRFGIFLCGECSHVTVSACHHASSQRFDPGNRRDDDGDEDGDGDGDEEDGKLQRGGESKPT